MLEFEKETGKNAIHNKKVTGQFEYWLWKKKTHIQSNKKPTTKPVKPKKEIEPISTAVKKGELYKNWYNKIVKCEKNPTCSKFHIHNLQGRIVEDYQHNDLTQEEAQKLNKYAQKVYDNKVRIEFGITIIK